MHRLLHEDGGLHCFRCGAFFANPRGDEYDAETVRADDDEMHLTASLVECTGPDTEHPGYYFGIVKNAAYRETCAVHPYECGE